MKIFEKFLNEIIQKVENTKIKITLSKTIVLDVDEINKIENGKNYIYVITAANKKDDLYGHIVEKINNLKDKKIKCCKVNKNNFNKLNYENLILYVGSSKELKNRLKQHFDIGKRYDVYSLHLSKETYRNLFSNIKIHLFEFDCDMAIVKMLEFYLWENLKPILGQKNNK